MSGHGFSRAADRPSLKFSPSVRVFAKRKPGPKAKRGLYGFVSGTTEEAAEKGLRWAEKPENRTAGAEARIDFIALAARLKSCPDASSSPG